MKRAIIYFIIIVFLSNFIFSEVLTFYFPNTGLGGLVIIPMVIALSIGQSLLFGLLLKRNEVNKYVVGLVLMIVGFALMMNWFPQDGGGSVWNKLFH